MKGSEAHSWGFFNRLAAPEAVHEEAHAWARDLASGPTFAHAMTKTMLEQEWTMSVDQAIEAEAQAQAICMQTRDFERAYHAFVNKETPDFQGD
jgi:enoyl-CoA hydratase/carnithine racemase